MVALHLFVSRTRLGKAMRATAQDAEAARMMGVDVDRVIVTAFFLGSALAGAAALIFGLYYNYTSFIIGYTAGLRAFTAAVLGGIGSIPGAMVGGLLIGLIESLGGQLIAVRWTDVIIFSILVLVLVFAPAACSAAPPRPNPEHGGERPAAARTCGPRRAARRGTACGVGSRRAPGRARGVSSLAAAALLFPILHRNDADIDSAANALTFAALALGLNIVVGFAGLLDLGYAAFFAIGAYAYGIAALVAAGSRHGRASGSRSSGSASSPGFTQPAATSSISRCRSG